MEALLDFMQPVREEEYDLEASGRRGDESTVIWPRRKERYLTIAHRGTLTLLDVSIALGLLNVIFV